MHPSIFHSLQGPGTPSSLSAVTGQAAFGTDHQFITRPNNLRLTPKDDSKL